MGEFSASNSPWKKMVLSKSDNEWSSTIKSEPEGTCTLNSTNLSIDYNPYANIKKEPDVVNNHETYEIHIEDEEETEIIQEVDPLLVHGSPPRRRRGSGPKPESPEERSARLAKMSAYAAARLANETPEQRAVRLKRMSEYAAKRLASESGEQRAKRLARMSAYAAKRLAKETPEQRQARLSRMSAYAAKRQAMKKGSNSTTSRTEEIHLSVPIYDPHNLMPNQS